MQNWVKIILRDVLFICRELEICEKRANSRLIIKWFACVVNNVNFITWSTCDQVKAKFCFNSSGGVRGGFYRTARQSCDNA